MKKPIRKNSILPTPKMKPSDCHTKKTPDDFTRPQLMGILNLTKDSFYDGGKIKSDKDLLTQAERMLEEGADILDLGACSSRPGALPIALEEERSRLADGVRVVLKTFPEAVVSIDTYRSEVACAGLEAGAQIVNDISAGEGDAQMFQRVAEKKATYVMMHMRGTSQTMMQYTVYEDLISDLIRYFKAKIAALQSLGVKNIILDPGFGFAKTTAQNFELLNKLDRLRVLNFPILCGVSRKSMIYKTLGITPAEALNGTTALHIPLLMKGATLLRVHDVREAKQTIKLYHAMTAQT